MFADFTRLGGVIGLGVLLAAGAGRGAAGPTSGFIQYEQTTAMPRPQRAPLKLVEKLWFKGQNYRQESHYPATEWVTLRGPEGTFVILPGGRGAMRMASPLPVKRHGQVLPLPVQQIPGLMFPDTTVIPRFAKPAGHEKVGRYSTTVYESRSRTPAFKGQPAQETVVRYWVSPTLPVPVKIVSKATPGATIVSLLQTARFNQAIPDSMFRLPKGTPVHAAPAPQPLPQHGAGRKTF